MREPEVSPTPEDTEHPVSGLDRIVAEYVDRLNAGERLDPLEVVADHPDHGEKILERLETFVGLSPDQPDQPLGTLGDYTLRRQIGRGGMGVVYEAWENSMDRAVALKVLPAGVAADEKAVTRFGREARLAGKLNHQNIVRVYSTGVREGTPWYSMEYVEGETLAQILARIVDAEPATKTPFGSKDDGAYFHNMAEAFADVADGLQHAHSKGVTHRDIKPSNLILDGEGRLRILDFGLARLQGQESLTLSGDFVGTPLYMSPEQARRKRIPVDHRTDVYSLGATLYEACCGRPPFRGTNHADTLSQIIERDPVELRTINARVPVSLETIILKCLRKDAGDRYGTAEAVGQDLRRFMRGDPVEARPQANWEKLVRRLKRNRLKLLAISSVLLLGSIAGWLALERAEVVRQLSLEIYDPLVLEAIRPIRLGELTLRASFGKPVSIPSRETYVPFLTAVDLSSLGREMLEGHVQAAVDSLTTIAASVPRRVDAPYWRARGLTLLGRGGEARTVLERILEIRPGFEPATALMETLEPPSAGSDPRLPKMEWAAKWRSAYDARLRQDQGAAADAFGDLVRYSRRHGEPYAGAYLEFLVGRGRARFEVGDWDGAIEDFAAASDRQPEFLEARILLGAAYHRQGKPDQAARIFEAFHRETSVPDEAGLWIAATYRWLRDDERGLQWAERIERAPIVRARLRSVFLVHLARFEEALNAASESVALSPDDPVCLALQGLAVLYYREHRGWTRRTEWTRKLLAIGDKLSELEAGNVFGLVFRIMALGDLGQAREARELLTQAVAQVPENALIHVAAAWNLLKTDPGEAEQSARRAVELDQAFVLAHLALAFALYLQRQFQDSIAVCNGALEIEPAFHGLQYCKAIALFGSGDVEQALRVSEDMFRLNPYRPRLRLAYAEGLELLGRFREALLAYGTRMELFPEDHAPDVRFINLFLLHEKESSPGALARLLERLEPCSRGVDKVHPDRIATLAVLHAFAPGGDGAEKALRRLSEVHATSIRPSPAVSVVLARMLLEDGKSDEAIRVLEDVRQTPRCLRTAETLLEDLGAPTVQPPGPPLDGEQARSIRAELEANGVVRIACGHEDPVQLEGVTWGPDRCFYGGRRFRFGWGREFPHHELGGYRVPVPPGEYTVTISIRESWFKGSGVRVFDLDLEGRPVLSAVDPFRENGLGRDTWRFEIQVLDGSLDIDFEPRVGDPIVSGIAIEKI